MSHAAYISNDPRASVSTDSVLVATTTTNGVRIAGLASQAGTVDAITAGQELRFGSLVRTPVRFNGVTAGRDAVWDPATNSLAVGPTTFLAGATAAASTSTIQGLQMAAAQPTNITGARTLTAADSGGCWSVAKTGVYSILLPAAAPGLRFKFFAADNGNNVVTITATAAVLVGNFVTTTAAAVVYPIAAKTNIVMTAICVPGDWVLFEGASTGWHVSGAQGVGFTAT